MGCAAIWVPAVPPPTMSPTHPDMDPVWARCRTLDVPFVCHLGGGPLFLREGFAKNGKKIEAGRWAARRDPRQGLHGVHYRPEAFLSAMILDGVLEKLPAAARRSHRAGRDVGGAVAAASWISRRTPSCASSPT